MKKSVLKEQHRRENKFLRAMQKKKDKEHKTPPTAGKKEALNVHGSNRT